MGRGILHRHLLSAERIGLIVGLCLIVAMLVFLGSQEVLESARKVPTGTLVLTLVGLGGVVAIGAFNVYLLIPVASAVSYPLCLRLYWLAWSIGLFVPGQLADAVSLSIGLSRHGLSIKLAAGAVLWDKIISLSVMLVIAGVGLCTLFYTHADSWLISDGSINSLPLLMFLALALLVVGAIGRRRKHTVQNIQLQLQSAWEQLGGLNAALKNVVGTCVKFCLIGAIYFIILRQLTGIPLSFFMVTSLALAAGLVAYIPISFNGIGTVELAAIFLFGKLGVPEAPVFTAYLILRGSNMLLGCVPAGFWLFKRPVER